MLLSAPPPRGSSTFGMLGRSSVSTVLPSDGACRVLSGMGSVFLLATIHDPSWREFFLFGSSGIRHSIVDSGINSLAPGTVKSIGISRQTCRERCLDLALAKQTTKPLLRPR